MDGQFRLGGSFKCSCGRTHEVPVRSFYYQKDAIEKAPDILATSLGGQPLGKSVVVADERTFRICGQRVAARLSCKSLIVPDGPGKGPVCDDSTCLWLKQQLSRTTPQLVVAVGSGTINDLCKWAAFEMKLPYAVVATAASMNGYAAANVAAKVRGVKVILRAAPPLAVLAEPAVIEHAPAEMTAAGFADTLAKFFSKADWIMNSFLFDEHYCGYCADILNDIQSFYLDNPEKLRTADGATIKALFEALFLTGIAMTMVGTSAPASGGEHLLSHVLDMTADIDNQRHSLHGLQVGLGTIVSAALYEQILAIDEPVIHKLPRDIDAPYWRNDSLIDSVSEQYAAKQDSAQTAAGKIAQPKTFTQLKNKLRPVVKTPSAVKDLLRRAGAAAGIKDLGLSRQRATEALLHMHEIRRRFTVVDLAWLTGVLPGAIGEVIDTNLSQ